MKKLAKVLIAIVGTILVVIGFTALFFGLIGAIVFLAAHKVGAWILGILFVAIMVATVISVFATVASGIYKWADARWPNKNQ